jgi:hypothetical protein
MPGRLTPDDREFLAPILGNRQLRPEQEAAWLNDQDDVQAELVEPPKTPADRPAR